jgi:hypothetical protein
MSLVPNIAMGLIAQMFVAYAVSYAVTYIATGSAKAAQGAGLSAALFVGNCITHGISNKHLSDETHCNICHNGLGNCCC